MIKRIVIGLLFCVMFTQFPTTKAMPQQQPDVPQLLHNLQHLHELFPYANFLALHNEIQEVYNQIQQIEGLAHQFQQQIQSSNAQRLPLQQIDQRLAYIQQYSQQLRHVNEYKLYSSKQL
jgi:hypothetical protein